MTIDKGIFIKNIYYMLSYAFQALKQEDYEKVAAEKFEKIEDLFAAILARGISVQLKRGLYREYVGACEKLTVLKGKLNMRETVRLNANQSIRVVCEYDTFSENNLYNQILKTTMVRLIRAHGVDDVQKSFLKKLLIVLGNIDTIPTEHINWNKLIYQRSNRSYELLMNICYLLLTGMLQTTEDGNFKLLSFSDEHMEKLFERFVLAYYKAHHPELSPDAPRIDWDIDDSDSDLSIIQFLPKMQTDMTLSKDGKTLIIDTKYYSKSLSEHYDKATLRSSHLYQIFAYVKNLDTENTGDVSGLLLYAKASDDYFPDSEPVLIGGNKIGVCTLDLNQDFSEIAAQLERIIGQYF